LATHAAGYNYFDYCGPDMSEMIDLNSRRAYEARLSKKIGKRGYEVLLGLSILFGLGAVALGITQGIRYGLLLLSPTILCLIPAIWWRNYLSILPVKEKETDFTARLSVDILSRLDPKKPLTSQDIWAAISDHWQAAFILNHLLFHKDDASLLLEQSSPDELKQALELAEKFAEQNWSKQIELGFLAAGLMMTSSGIRQRIIEYKGRPEDIAEVANWLGRNILDFKSRDTQNFGGIGRDWAFGFTPILNRVGMNVSLNIAHSGSHYGWLMGSEGVRAMEAAFDNHSSAVALIGQIGIGKTNSVYALAQLMIEGHTSQTLAYHQIVSVNATDIISNAHGPGELERIMISIFNEATHAGHIILFLDDAEAFFSDGHGAFDASQIIFSLVQARGVPLIMALTPNGFERLKSRNPNLASLLTPVVLQELPELGVIRVLEDFAVSLENKHKILITYESLLEAYSLSGRYDQDEAYPGRAIKLLEQAVSYSSNSIVTVTSVQMAIQQTKGVKLGSAGPAEANELLNLEAKIHERMINQSNAVSVVANSLRRARAGVSNPKRPIGSFLFLGPTGVGKTELAKSLAATYFGNETNMIRLDMTEYQQESDVSRILSDGSSDSKSLIMAVRQQPFSVVLLDEIEKAHPNILNLLLQLLDEGQLTDVSGRSVSFKDCIIISTSNAGAQSIRDHIDKGEEIESFKTEFMDELIKSNQFKPELINRFDEIVIFRPLKPEELVQVVKLMLGEINTTLSNQNIVISLTDAAINKIVNVGYDPRLGARPMRRTLQHAVEDTIAQKILKGEVKPGEHVQLDVNELSL
jgi:ATP-dependent Clp protease ATP-binding subunit ClpC